MAEAEISNLSDAFTRTDLMDMLSVISEVEATQIKADQGTGRLLKLNTLRRKCYLALSHK